ncbi:2-oxoglutarate and iron-dependent oxygenase JMJD4 [Impatiens glandulifera]|uniref:2-oxoglutarate and iron-dependent oxygenase JMJD4 n=1 Tax=Impatiens glandulifera TaxID=253017 RepID=UPI001FB0A29F|nr:2-oxoglutarate and iron-dependent oxygenase JMJD4 [Impatiens glandulifera]
MGFELLNIGGRVEKVNGKNLTYAEFAERFLSKNKPVLLTGLMVDWRASKDWVLDDGRPNLPFFSSHFGDSKVQVADCSSREFSDQRRTELLVSEFIDHWVSVQDDDSDHKPSNEFGCKSPLYLKDWHFKKEYQDYIAYTTPLFFSDDWLNMYLDKFRMHTDPDYQEKDEIVCSDYRFVYMGAKGTWTPLHADVFRSYSWSANVCGKKLWYLLPPSQSHLVFDRNMKTSVYDILEETDQVKFPGFKEAIWLECTQAQGEIIFVPSGWYHQVHNLEDTISINHNWFNAYNLCWVWDLLLRDYKEAKEYIEDIKDICDDFEGLCQRNLAANTGMNYQDFFIFMVRLSFGNLVLLYQLVKENETSGELSMHKGRQIILNLESARDIAMKMMKAGSPGLLVNFKETIEDPTFVRLCLDLERIYLMIHEPRREQTTEDLTRDLVDLDLLDSSAFVGSPEDLANLIYKGLRKLTK